MGIQFLIIDILADFFGDFFYIMVPMCYFYVYRQLFGYNFWGNLWRVLLMFISGILLALFTIMFPDWLIIGSTDINKYLFLYVIFAMVSMIVGMLISKMLAEHKKLSQILKNVIKK